LRGHQGSLDREQSRDLLVGPWNPMSIVLHPETVVGEKSHPTITALIQRVVDDLFCDKAWDSFSRHTGFLHQGVHTTVNGPFFALEHGSSRFEKWVFLRTS